MRIVFIIKTEDGIFRTIICGFDYCHILEKLNNELNACYFNWEIIKHWNL